MGLIKFKNLDISLYKTSTALIIKELVKRGIDGYVYRQGSPYLFIKHNNKTIKFFSTMPDKSSRFYTGIAGDKYITSEIAKDLGIPSIESLIFSKDNNQLAINLFRDLQLRGNNLVIKPLDSAHGNGIRVNLSTEQEVVDAIEYASEFSSLLIAQEYLQNKEDIRVLCAGGEVIAVANRVPASVEGNGHNNIEDLIKISNNSRSKDYTDGLVQIDLERAREFLKERMSKVLEKGKIVRVLGISNIGAGGSAVDVTDIIPEGIKNMALKLASELNLEVVGVDFLVNSINYEKTSMSVSDLDPIFIEINACPGLSPHFLAEKYNNITNRCSTIAEKFVDYILSS